MPALQEKSLAANSKRFAGKIALVTGGSRGIGAAIALKLASEGAIVIITYASNKTAADTVIAHIKKLGSKAVAVKANVTSKQDTESLIAEIEKLGKIDILVNNAAVVVSGSLEESNLDQFDQAFNTNVKGVVATTLAVLPYINDGGHLINISSGAARASMANFGFYSATKAALEALTRCWAQELGKRQITVNAIAPGTTQTDMLEQGLTKEAQQAFIDKTALGRVGQPADIADAVVFFASDDSRWITGKTIDCDGGLAL